MDLLDRMCCGDGRDGDTRTNRWSVAQDVPLTAEHRDDNSCDHDDPMIVVRDALNVDHHLRCVLAEGWVQKKRSENDRKIETLWKYRWARLVLARTPASPLQVPLLLIYRYPHSDAGSPSTVCHLDSTVIFPVDLEREENSADETGLLADACGFEIQPAGSAPPEASAHAGLILAAFSASARNAWIYAISAALLAYEKEKAYRRRVSPKILPRSPSSKSRRGMRPGHELDSPGANPATQSVHRTINNTLSRKSPVGGVGTPPRHPARSGRAGGLSTPTSRPSLNEITLLDKE